MFNNIGSKIKGLAKVLCWISIIADIILGIVLCSAGGHSDILVTIGMIIIFAGPLLSWISSFFLVAIGETIIQLTKIADENEKIAAGTKSIAYSINELNNALSSVQPSVQPLNNGTDSNNNTDNSKEKGFKSESINYPGTVNDTAKNKSVFNQCELCLAKDTTIYDVKDENGELRHVCLECLLKVDPDAQKRI